MTMSFTGIRIRGLITLVGCACAVVLLIFFGATIDESVVKANRENKFVKVHHCKSTMSKSLPVGWCADEDNFPRFMGAQLPGGNRTSASVRHYTHAGYEKCLAGKTVVFIGDSRVRYQYMHLARYLATKHQMRCNDFYQTIENQTSEGDEDCFLINHQLHGKKGASHWNAFYKISTDLLQMGGKQDGLCDCFRSVPFNPAQTYENRFNTQSTQYGNIRLVYLQHFGRIHMNKQYPPLRPFSLPMNDTGRCKPGECDGESRVDAFQGSLKETMWTILPMLNATHAFVNEGWAEMDVPIANLNTHSALSCAITEFQIAHPDIEVNLITHIPSRVYPSQRSGYTSQTNGGSSSFAERMKCPIRILDRFHAAENVPDSWYFDNLHVLSILNEEYNHELIEMICPLDDNLR